MRVPELIMAPDWPYPRELDDDLTQIPSLRLFWPVPSLPEEMGWLPAAVHLPDDPSQQYFLEVDATFYGDGVCLYGVDNATNGAQPAIFIPYDQLAHFIAEADTAVRGRADPPARLTLYRTVEPSGRRCRAYLGVHEAPDPTTAPTSDDELPF